MAKIGFIGMGNMGYSMLKGVLNYLNPQKLAMKQVSDTLKVMLNVLTLQNI